MRAFALLFLPPTSCIYHIYLGLRVVGFSLRPLQEGSYSLKNLLWSFDRKGKFGISERPSVTPIANEAGHDRVVAAGSTTLAQIVARSSARPRSRGRGAGSSQRAHVAEPLFDASTAGNGGRVAASQRNHGHLAPNCGLHLQSPLSR